MSANRLRLIIQSDKAIREYGYPPRSVRATTQYLRRRGYKDAQRRVERANESMALFLQDEYSRGNILVNVNEVDNYI